ncbi:hypothetical protein AVEN_145653-1 [Araneus ventricosus]|uniref:Uncharacterized protein n=1 Tax=Araneus ventricosus TaxID=182803 RepID=A0A4Y2QPL3_ARAVE|nr:hypothetical protein AVEN_145653-1 [Araneus ventricosus]
MENDENEEYFTYTRFHHLPKTTKPSCNFRIHSQLNISVTKALQQKEEARKSRKKDEGNCNIVFEGHTEKGEKVSIPYEKTNNRGSFLKGDDLKAAASIFEVVLLTEEFTVCCWSNGSRVMRIS